VRPRLYCATSNPGKLAEFQAAAPPELDLLPADAVDCPETGASFEGNAVQKALCYAEALQDLVFADDSGLEVDALGGEPGLRSARFAGPGATDEQNRALLLERLRLLRRAGGPLPAARFVCVIALAQPGDVLATFQGSAEGVILEAPRGRGGFGYDPLFLFPPLGRTFAELDPAEKFARSHRGRAFRALLEWLAAHPEVLTASPPN
jgi:XTP/dITP diphosphohydrolase